MKYFGLAALALAMTVGASANTFTETCTSAVGANGVTSITPSQTLSCSQFSTLPAGATLTGVQFSISNSFNQGTPGVTDSFDFYYTLIDTDITGAPAQSNTTGVITGAQYFNYGNQVTTDLSAYLGSGSINIASVIAGVDSSEPGSSLTASGQLGSTLFATFTYTPASSGVPEPGSMMLLGSGLVAFALAGRKLVRK